MTARARRADEELRVVDLSAADGVLLERFYRELYVAEFPVADERESLANMLAYLRSADETNAYLVTLSFDGDRIVGGCVADYFRPSSCGVIEFLVVDPRLRGAGIGSDLTAHVERRMHAAASARGKTLALVFAEINDPFKRATTPDNVDPFTRLTFWARHDYRRLAFPYRQPALSCEQEPVENLLLAAKSYDDVFGNAVPAERLAAFLRDYLIYAMRIAEPAASPQFAEMAAFLAGHETIALEDLRAYVGDDPARPFEVHPIALVRDPDFAAAMRVYRRAFPDRRLAVAEDVFASLLLAPRPDMTYHLWALRAASGAAVAGMASFFGLAHAGFGGYAALEGALRGTGRLRPLLARQERRLAVDSTTTRGWYIECEPDVAPIFEHCGFYRVALPYRQPILADANAPPLSLLYKEFGASETPPRVDVATFRASLDDIAMAVYGLGPQHGSTLLAEPVSGPFVAFEAA